MFTVNEEIKINWTIYSKNAPPTLEDISISIYSPDGTIRNELPVEKEEYIPPKAKKLGYIAYNVIPDIAGIWKIKLYVSGRLINTKTINVKNTVTSTNYFINTGLI